MEEAWLEGPIEGILPELMPAAHALTQAARDIETVMRDFPAESLWTRPNGAASVGFHLLHIKGSIDRLASYARGEKLREKQYAALRAEKEVDESVSPEKLKEKAVGAIEKMIGEIKATRREILFEKRAVGRKALPSSVFGLLFHIAEHTQRHVGQIITTAKVVRNSSYN
jgi:hypothetical protein